MSVRLSCLTITKLVVGMIACCDKLNIFLQIADDRMVVNLYKSNTFKW